MYSTMNVAASNNMVAEPATELEVASGNDRQFLDFDISKVQTLTLEQLARTEKGNDYNGNPLMGIYHFQLIQQIQEMCAERGYRAEIWDLFAANNKDRRAPGVSRLPKRRKNSVNVPLKRTSCAACIATFVFTTLTKAKVTKL